jgi:hypothetical protein
VWACECLHGFQDRSASACGWVNYHTNEASLAAEVCLLIPYGGGAVSHVGLQAVDCVSERRCELLGKMSELLKRQAMSAAQSDVVVRDCKDCGSLPVVELQ